MKIYVYVLNLKINEFIFHIIFAFILITKFS